MGGEDSGQLMIVVHFSDASFDTEKTWAATIQNAIEMVPPKDMPTPRLARFVLDISSYFPFVFGRHGGIEQKTN